MMVFVGKRLYVREIHREVFSGDRITMMRKLCLLCMFVILSVTGISCANQPSVDETTLTTTVEPTESPVILTATPEPTKEVIPTVTPTSTVSPTLTVTPTVTPTPVPVYVFRNQDKPMDQKLVSLVNDKDYQTVVYFESGDMVYAIVSNSKIELLPDGTIKGSGRIYVVLYDQKKEELLFMEKKIAEDGFHAAFLPYQETVYVPVTARNDYCGVEYYDMSIYRVENGQVSMGQIAEGTNTVQWWQDYMPVLTADGKVELYIRKTTTKNFTNDLMEETKLDYGDKVQTEKQDYNNRLSYAEKFAYTWEYAYVADITELEYLTKQRILTGSQVFVDVMKESVVESQSSLKFRGIACSVTGKVDGYQMVVCKRLGASAAAGSQNIAVMLYDKQGNLVDSEYYTADQASVSWSEDGIDVFAGYYIQGFTISLIKPLVEGTVFWEDDEIKYLNTNEIEERFNYRLP